MGQAQSYEPQRRFVKQHTMPINPPADDPCSLCLELYDTAPSNDEEPERCLQIVGIKDCRHHFGHRCLWRFLTSSLNTTHLCPFCRNVWLPSLVEERKRAARTEILILILLFVSTLLILGVIVYHWYCQYIEPDPKNTLVTFAYEGLLVCFIAQLRARIDPPGVAHWALMVGSILVVVGLVMTCSDLYKRGGLEWIDVGFSAFGSMAAVLFLSSERRRRAW